MVHRASAAAIAVLAAGAIASRADAQVQTFAPNQVGAAFGTSYTFDNNTAVGPSGVAESGSRYVASSPNSTTPVYELFTTTSKTPGTDPYTPDPFTTASTGPVPSYQGSNSNGLTYLNWSAEDIRQGTSTMSGSLASGKTAEIGVNMANFSNAGWSLGNGDYGRPTGYLSMQLHSSATGSPEYSILFGLVNRPVAPGANASNNYSGNGYTGSASYAPGDTNTADGFSSSNPNNYGNWVAPATTTPELEIQFSSGDGTVEHNGSHSDQMQFLVPSITSLAQLENTQINFLLSASSVDFTIGGQSVIGGPQSLATPLDSGFLSDPNLLATLELAADNGDINTDASYITGDTTSLSEAVEFNSISVGSVTPEPASLGLLALGGFGLLARRRAR